MIVCVGHFRRYVLINYFRHDRTSGEGCLFDVHRAVQFIAELSFDKENPVTINDLKNDKFTTKLPMNSFNSKQSVQSIIQYWDMFGEIPIPSNELREEVINKHEKHFKKLSSTEKEFFMHC